MLTPLVVRAQEEYEEDGILEGATEEVPLASEHYGHNKAEVLPVGKL